MRVRAAAGLLAVAVLAGGCGLIPTDSPLVPGSQWRVVAVDDEPTNRAELILTFIGETATLSSECGARTADVFMAEDTHAVTFGQFSTPAGEPSCPDEAEAEHQRVATVLEGIYHWVQVGRRIELQGQFVIRLEPQRTDT